MKEIRPTIKYHPCKGYVVYEGNHAVAQAYTKKRAEEIIAKRLESAKAS